MPHVFIKISPRVYELFRSLMVIDCQTFSGPVMKKVLLGALTVGAYAKAFKFLNGDCFACVNVTQEKEAQQDFIRLENLLTGVKPATSELLATFLR